MHNIKKVLVKNILVVYNHYTALKDTFKFYNAYTFISCQLSANNNSVNIIVHPYEKEFITFKLVQNARSLKAVSHVHFAHFTHMIHA